MSRSIGAPAKWVCSGVLTMRRPVAVVIAIPSVRGERWGRPPAALVPIEVLGELVSIGTLFAFVLVCGAVIYLRRSESETFRPFRVPGVPVVPILGILFCVLLMAGLPLVTWARLAIWLVVGMVIYVSYGRSHSILRHPGRRVRVG